MVKLLSIELRRTAVRHYLACHRVYFVKPQVYYEQAIVSIFQRRLKNIALSNLWSTLQNMLLFANIHRICFSHDNAVMVTACESV